MTQKDKELLLKDLSARLPYGVIVRVYSNDGDYDYSLTGIINSQHEYPEIEIDGRLEDEFCIQSCKPYLRPISSMTEEENKEAKENGCIIYWDTSPEDKGLSVFASPKGFDWLNKKMFDYRKDDEGKTMIEKGLALEAPEGMYNIE